DEIKAFVGIERDVTQEKKIDKTKSEFVSIASHQLRTPLTGIKWFIEVMKDEKLSGPLSELQKKYIASLLENTERMISLVNDLLNVSRIETGKKFNIERTKQNIIDTIDEAIEENQNLAKSAKIKIKKHKSLPKKLKMYIDNSKILEVFNNIINNAVKYSSQEDTITVGLKENNKDDATFYIEDEGIGIPDKAQDQVFKKFYRAENVLKQQTDGSGLGLYIARAIVNGHEGKIWFESEQDKGTTFFIELPKTKPEPKEAKPEKLDSMQEEVKQKIAEALVENEERKQSSSSQKQSESGKQTQSSPSQKT
ncbi:hypothetical protein GF389_04060, partial [Candidatus Dojkabacteria bacterium]|nr:hypothetical protein [Candidatus Dojkabacteria bacterium]